MLKKWQQIQSAKFQQVFNIKQLYQEVIFWFSKVNDGDRDIKNTSDTVLLNSTVLLTLKTVAYNSFVENKFIFKGSVICDINIQKYHVIY